MFQAERDRAAPGTRPDRRARIGVLLVGAAVALTAVVMALRTVAHAREPVYELPTIAVVTVWVACALVVCGAIGMVRARQPVVALLTALTMLLFVIGVLAILSIGILFVIAAAAALVALFRAHPSRDEAAVLSGVVLSAGLAVVLLVSLQPPIVECMDGGGVRESSRVWWGLGDNGSVSGEGSFQLDSTTTGTITMGSRSYSYTCRDGRLARFTKD